MRKRTMAWFNINYLKEPQISKGVGQGMAAAAIGDSLMKLGLIGQNRDKIDTEKQKSLEDSKHKKMEFDYKVQKDMQDRAFEKEKLDKELLYKDRELKSMDEARKMNGAYHNALKQELIYKRSKQEAMDRANVELYRQMYPNESRGKSDDYILALGNLMQKTKDSGARDSESIKVGADFFREYAHLGVVEKRKDGFYAKKDFVDSLANEAEARSEARGRQAGYSDRVLELKKSKPLIFGDGAM